MHSRRARFIFFATSVYAILSLAWILLSEQLLSMFTENVSLIWLSIAKDGCFLIVTAALYFLSLRSVPPARDSGRTTLQSIFTAGLRPERKSRWLIYLLAIVITLAMVPVRESIVSSIGNRPLLILFMLPIILSALFGGLGQVLFQQHWLRWLVITS